MTHVLETKNFGCEVVAPSNKLSEEIDMGTFSIYTQDFCDFVTDLANGKEAKGVLDTKGKLVKFVYDGKRNIEFGIYKIDVYSFADLVMDVYGGGFPGWINRGIPIYVKDSIQAIKENDSKSDCFLVKNLRKVISITDKSLFM